MSLKPNNIFSLLVLLGIGVITQGQTQDLGSDLESWGKIFSYACGSPGVKDEMMASQFHHCYSFLEPKGRQIFGTCQMEVFGVILNSKAHLDQACKNAKSDSLSMYISCLQKGYEKSGLDFEKAASVVNACDGRVFQLDNGNKMTPCGSTAGMST